MSAMWGKKRRSPCSPSGIHFHARTWEYADEFLVTLCANCHTAAHIAAPVQSKKPELPAVTLSVKTWTKEQRYRLWHGMAWINRNMVGGANSLRKWIIENGSGWPEEALYRLDAFLLEHRK